MLMTPSTALPDPDHQAEFYADVAIKRAIAWLIDTALIVLLCLLILPFTIFTALFFFPVFVITVGFIYRVLTIAGGSATWGMRAMAIEMRTHRGARLGFGLALAHTLAYSLSFAMVVPQVISGLLMLTTARAQGLGDLLLGTVVMNRAAQG